MNQTNMNTNHTGDTTLITNTSLTDPRTNANPARTVDNAGTVNNADSVSDVNNVHVADSVCNGNSVCSARSGDGTARVVVAHGGIGFDGLSDRDVDERLRELRQRASRGKFMRRADDFFLGSILKAYREENGGCGSRDAAVDRTLGRWDDRAKEILTMANSRAVFKTANMMYNQMNLGADRDELVAEGMRGLARAFNSYDPTTGYKFLTYATMWIRQHIQRHGRDIARITKLPMSQISRMSKVDARVREIRERGENVDRTMFARILEEERITMNDYLKIRAFNTIAESTDSQAFIHDTGDNSSTEFSEIMDVNKYELAIMGERPTDPAIIVENETLTDMVQHALNELTPEEERVMRTMYYETILTDNGERDMTMTQARERLGLKRREFSRILDSAKAKLHKTLSREPSLRETYQG